MDCLYVRKDSSKLPCGYQKKSSALAIFSQKQSFLKNELICFSGSVVTDIDALDLNDYTLSGFAFFLMI